MGGNNEKKWTTKIIAVNGIMMALVFVATFFTRIPIPMTQGYFNIGDTVIIITAILMGPASGLIVGALGSMLSDVAAGYFLFAPLTLIVKGLEGYLIGKINALNIGGLSAAWKRVIAVSAGMLVMAIGYFTGEAYILSIFSKDMGYAAAAAEFPLNMLQAGISGVVGFLLTSLMTKLNAEKYFK
ncbi:MAG: ECF transporter S component [Eubacteriales bacterium]|nr:ECF transporter S component [Eubacteriales bacterium]